MENRGRQPSSRQRGNNGTNTPTSPTLTSSVRHVRAASYGISGVRRAQTKAAAQRLAAVMSNQNDDEEDDDNNAVASAGSNVIGLGGTGRAVRPRSPMVIQSSSPSFYHLCISELES